MGNLCSETASLTLVVDAEKERKYCNRLLSLEMTDSRSQ